MPTPRALLSGIGRSVFRHIPYLKQIAARRERSKFRFPAGHFYSPIPDVDEVERRSDELFAEPTLEVAGVDLRIPQQLALMQQFDAYYADQPFSEQPAAGMRYYFDNPYYRHGDGFFLHAMIRQFRPKRIIEVGSGFSSAVILDANDRFCGGSIECTFIEPNPERLNSLLTSADQSRVRIIAKPVQQVPVDLFDQLTANDILLIDSTHVAKIGSDVNHLFFKVIPRLKEQVLLHIHDIAYPFEYPREWVLGGMAWNEAYLLRAFLQYNNAFQIALFNSLLPRIVPNFNTRFPLVSKDPGGSIWLVKAKSDKG